MRTLPVFLALLLFSALPARGQTLGDLVAAIQTGGGWVTVDIEDGRGTLRTVPVPTGGMTLRGCMQIWAGHSGRWTIEAADVRGDSLIAFDGAPGTPHPLAYRTGMTTEVDVSVRWSEPRDTTLLVWVGLERPGSARDPCEPVYGSGR